eukprot:TRINITY_DN63817_c0_g1_i1.p1 TRINITY_DN63817_c0_g1~~TRINITY_DN63817_c0_g1_i1.p1  ORF type:complete len:406 (+),score=135.04 TRINITY_DN63817_c0_g1_i1:124-1341(+)
MDPTPEEAAAIKTVGAAIDWAGLKGSADDLATPRGAFLEAFGLEESDPPRVVAIMPESDYTATSQALKQGEKPVPPAIVAKALLVFRACRHVCEAAKAAAAASAPAVAAPAEREPQQPRQAAPPAATEPTAVAKRRRVAEDESTATSTTTPVVAAAPAAERHVARAAAGDDAPESSYSDEEDAAEHAPAGLGYQGASAGQPAKPPGGAGGAIAFQKASASDAPAPAVAAAAPAKDIQAAEELSPAEKERRKLAEFEAKLKSLEEDNEDASWQQSSGGDAYWAEQDDIAKRSVYIGGLDFSTSPEELQKHFQACGTVARTTVMQGFAYMEFKDRDGLQNALLLNGSEFRGATLKVVQKSTMVKGKGKPKGKDKDKGKGKSKGPDGAKGKGKGKSKFTNMVWTPTPK